jgi:hypothetical protein
MTNAIINTIEVLSGSVPNLLNAINTLLVNDCGFTNNLLTIPTTTTAVNSIWSKQLTTGVTFNNFSVLLGLTNSEGQSSNAIQYGTSFNGSTGVNNGTTSQNAFIPNDTGNYFLTSINHPEVCGVQIVKGSGILRFIGYWRPLTVPTWWNQNSFLFAFSPHTRTNAPSFTSTSHSYALSSSLRPTGANVGASGDFPLFLNYGAQILDANPINNTTTLLKAPAIVNFNNNGLVARFSEDIACIADKTSPIGKKYKAEDNSIYTIIEPVFTNNLKMRMAVRTA